MNARLIAIVVCVVTATVYLSMFMTGGSSTEKRSFVSKDRSENYKVKVISADLDDESLNALPKETFSYLAMIDAGSSGCRAHVYRYGKLGSVEGPLYILPHHVSKKVKPGLSSFAQNPQGAGVSLKDLIEFMRQEVPESDWAVTPIWLKATAGLRMLDPAQSDAVLSSVRAFLSDKANSPFMFRQSWARVISGNEEGGFGWIAYNYLRKIIGPKKTADGHQPYAVVEMGGASSQVSQLAPSKAEADKIPKDYRFSFTIEEDTFHLYTHSYLGFGAEQGREQLNKLLTSKLTAANAGDSKTETIRDPCLNAGFARPGTVARKETYEGPQGVYFNISGAADASICTTTVANVFSGGAGKTCDKSHEGPFSFGCTYQPAFVAESKNFLLFENFFYMSSAIGVKPVSAVAATPANAPPVAPAFPLITTPSHILDATSKICNTEWSAVQTVYPLDSQPKDVNTKMCFIGAYSYSFLTHGLGIPADKQVTIQREVGKSEIEWALGAAYKEAADFLKRTNLRPT